jgi:phage terminase large subunit-like protein
MGAQVDFDPNTLLAEFGTDKVLNAISAESCERDLSLFLRESWHVYDPSPYQHAWHIDAIADHLMAVADGTIRRLLINVPPRCSKTRLASVAFPAWLWALRKDPHFPLHGPSTDLMCLAYNAPKAMEEAMSSNTLIKSKWYRDRWGDRFVINPRVDSAERFQSLIPVKGGDPTLGGIRVSTGINATVLGRGGMIKIIDDAMKPDEPDSEGARQTTIRTYDETLSSRENDPRIAAEVIIAQRLGQHDLPGHVLEKYGSDPDRGGFVHLMIPAEYDWERHCVTVLGWQDPRGCDADGEMLPGALRKMRDGTSFWPDRFSSEVLQQRRTAEGPFSYAAKYQQSPTPRGGGIIKTEWWKTWPSDAFPQFELVMVSVDTAHTAKDSNDESGITVWGVWRDPEEKNMPKLMLINSWEGRLEFFNLVNKIAELCKKHSADVCLVEGEANGIDAINELRRLHGRRDWTTVQFDPKGDKASRLLSVQPLFSGEYRKDPVTEVSDWVGGIVYAPDKDYAQLVIDRIAAFTGGKMKSLALVDTTSQALTWLRREGYLVTAEEHDADLEDELIFKPQRKAIYDV